jgi:hypothetical protein
MAVSDPTADGWRCRWACQLRQHAHADSTAAGEPGPAGALAGLPAVIAVTPAHSDEDQFLVALLRGGLVAQIGYSKILISP